MPSFQYRVFSGLISLLPLRISTQILYFRRFHRFANLNKPVTFNEKLQYRKIHDRNPLLTIAADKLASKRFVNSIVPDVYIPKVLWQGLDPSDIDFTRLPNDYVYKANHASQTNAFVRSGKHMSVAEMINYKNIWFKHDQSAVLGEWAYKNIPKMVFIEEFLSFNNDVPDDFKFFVFHGNVQFIQYDTGRFSNHKRNVFNKDWLDLGFNYNYERVMPPPSKPDFINDMIRYAEAIGSHFDFVRVDFYYLNGKVFFGELTIYPGAGFERFPDDSIDIEFGKHWIV